MRASAQRPERPWAFKYQWRKQGDTVWSDGESSAHCGTCLEMYKSPAWLAMHPNVEHRIITADGSVTWEHDPYR